MCVYVHILDTLDTLSVSLYSSSSRHIVGKGYDIHTNKTRDDELRVLFADYFG